MFITIIIFIILLSILVFVHELGHFVTARFFGVKAEEFGFGFPPRLAGIYKSLENKWKFVWGSREVADSSGTIYSLNWLPLGGFVKIKGEQGESRGDKDSLANQPIWRRAVILSAGVAMNLATAAVFLAVGFMAGLPQALDNVSGGADIAQRNLQIIQVLPDSPAQAAGLKMGDSVIALNGQPVRTYQELSGLVSARAGQKLAYQIKRGQEELRLEITPQLMPDSGQVGIGIAVAETGIVSYPWYQAVWEGIKSTLIMSWYIIVAFAFIIKDLFVGHPIAAELSGPVGIAVMTGQVVNLGFVYMLQFAAVLSINLAVINYAPFPALDGGRVLFLLIEKLRGRAVPEKVEATIHNIGFALLMLLVAIVTFKDVFKFSDKFLALFQKIF